MTYHAKIIAGGKIVIPADVRRALGVTDGDTIVVEKDVSGGYMLKTKLQVLREIQATMKVAIKKPFTMDEYLAQKWAESDVENASG
jgi:AbrB family transcriptional regulator, stage V sporulation protein T